MPNSVRTCLETFFLAAETNLRSRSEELSLATDRDSVEVDQGNGNIDWKSFEEAVGNEIKKTGKIIFLLFMLPQLFCHLAKLVTTSRVRMSCDSFSTISLLQATNILVASYQHTCCKLPTDFMQVDRQNLLSTNFVWLAANFNKL